MLTHGKWFSNGLFLNKTTTVTYFSTVRCNTNAVKYLQCNNNETMKKIENVISTRISIGNRKGTLFKTIKKILNINITYIR